ncbi:helix-turn-helix transcriptional regulator [Priestia taiwanensis]|uniref:DNA-binding protein n=1 Tax=Priestia taiwanensis TaxID=1347902 RepID=A0A917EJY4_9BACI|nr:WYL domain-containing protein [Priestia taiwanensis]MBM7361518.1 putative DNA-binding transcriptional regulator YafY [Priestia taiwanensis]GGE54807.1 DNA-binding protein [Priestia taiwanensis]
MSKLSNILRMIELLHARGKMKISELAEELEVKERMIRIYRDDLEKAGIFVEGEKGRSGGYSIVNKSFFPIRNMSSEEMRALVFAVEKLVSKGNVLHAGDAQAALDKLNAVQKVEMDKDRYVYFVQRSRPNYDVSDENRKYAQLQEAFSLKKKVEIVYETSSGRESTRTIEPYGFVHYNEFFYCTGLCTNRKAMRTFKLSRMKRIQLMNEMYTVPEDFNIQTEFPKLGIMKEQLDIELIIYPPFSLSVPESIWGENQTIEYLPDKSIRYRATMSGKESAKKWILGMGASVKVMEPIALRDEIMEEGRRLLELYDTF